MHIAPTDQPSELLSFVSIAMNYSSSQLIPKSQVGSKGKSVLFNLQATHRSFMIPSLKMQQSNLCWANVAHSLHDHSVLYCYTNSKWSLPLYLWSPPARLRRGHIHIFLVRAEVIAINVFVLCREATIEQS